MNKDARKILGNIKKRVLLQLQNLSKGNKFASNIVKLPQIVVVATSKSQQKFLPLPRQ
jgi:hypothetical protein